jgi:hypothetical protein
MDAAKAQSEQVKKEEIGRAHVWTPVTGSLW